MQGADMVHDARMYNEILRSYAGIIRIRFLGMISASVTRAPLQLICKCAEAAVLRFSAANIHKKCNSPIVFDTT